MATLDGGGRLRKRIQDAVAAARFAFRSSRLLPGDVVVLLAEQRCRSRLAPDHLPVVPAGTRGLVMASAPMRGAAGGVLIRLLDEAGRATRYWTGAPLHEVQRLPATVVADEGSASLLSRPLYPRR